MRTAAPSPILALAQGSTSWIRQARFHGRGARESQSLRPQHQSHSQVINDPDFWLYCKWTADIGYLAEFLSRWSEGCICHERETCSMPKPPGSSGATCHHPASVPSEAAEALNSPPAKQWPNCGTLQRTPGRDFWVTCPRLPVLKFPRIFAWIGNGLFPSS